MRFRWPSLVALTLSWLAASATPAAADEEDPVTAPAADAPGRARLRELFVARNGDVRVPASARYASLAERGRQTSRLLIGWVLPGVSGAGDRAELVQTAALLEQNGRGRLPTRLAAFGPGISVQATLDAIGQVPLLVIVVDTARAGSNKEVELAVLEAVAGLRDEPTVGSLVRRHLGPLARGVVEIHAPEAAVTVRVNKPLRHVIERGDTLSEIASRHGLDLDALIHLNGVDPKKPIHPGEELKLNAGHSPRPKLYVAKLGDTLATVARHFGVSEKALLDINRLGVEQLTVGQKLVLPP